MKTRDIHIDINRGIAIILVVLGHAIQTCMPETFDENPVFRLIYSFHMPFFMYISGVTLRYTNKKIDYHWLYERLIGLVIPYAVWLLIPFFFSNNWLELPSLMWKVLYHPDYGLWFLWILFLNSLLLFIVKGVYYLLNISEKFLVCGALLAITICKVVSRWTTIFGIDMLSWYSIFFFSGYFIQPYRENKKIQIVRVIFALSWFVFVGYWRRNAEPAFADSMIVLPDMIKKILSRVYMYVIPFGGIAMSFQFSIIMYYMNEVSKGIAYIGMCTMEIYVLQNFFFGVVKTDILYINIISNFVLGLFAPLCIAILNRKGYTLKLLYGR